MELTRRALHRHHQRVGGAPTPRAIATAVRVPYRLAAAHWPELVGAEPRRVAARVRCSSVALFLCRGRRVITVIALADADLATLLVWVLFRQWLLP